MSFKYNPFTDELDYYQNEKEIQPIKIGGFYFNITGVNPGQPIALGGLGYGTWLQVAKAGYSFKYCDNVSMACVCCPDFPWTNPSANNAFAVNPRRFCGSFLMMSLRCDIASDDRSSARYTSAVFQFASASSG